MLGAREGKVVERCVGVRVREKQWRLMLRTSSKQTIKKCFETRAPTCLKYLNDLRSHQGRSNPPVMRHGSRGSCEPLHSICIHPESGLLFTDSVAVETTLPYGFRVPTSALQRRLVTNLHTEPHGRRRLSSSAHASSSERPIAMLATPT